MSWYCLFLVIGKTVELIFKLAIGIGYHFLKITDVLPLLSSENTCQKSLSFTESSQVLLNEKHKNKVAIFSLDYQKFCSPN